MGRLTGRFFFSQWGGGGGAFFFVPSNPVKNSVSLISPVFQILDFQAGNAHQDRKGGVKTKWDKQFPKSFYKTNFILLCRKNNYIKKKKQQKNLKTKKQQKK